MRLTNHASTLSTASQHPHSSASVMTLRSRKRVSEFLRAVSGLDGHDPALGWLWTSSKGGKATAYRSRRRSVEA